MGRSMDRIVARKGRGSSSAGQPIPTSPHLHPESRNRGDAVMDVFHLREPVNAWSHGMGMLLSLPVTWVLWRNCAARTGPGWGDHSRRTGGLLVAADGSDLDSGAGRAWSSYQRGK